MSVLEVAGGPNSRTPRDNSPIVGSNRCSVPTARRAKLRLSIATDMPCLRHEKLMLVRDLPDPKSDIFGHGNPLRRWYVGSTMKQTRCGRPVRDEMSVLEVACGSNSRTPRDNSPSLRPQQMFRTYGTKSQTSVVDCYRHAVPTARKAHARP
jgi:hypothetical protein